MANRVSASNKILKNSFWFSIELALETIVFLGTSIAVAKYLGPEKLGHFAYINLFVTIITGAGAAGLSTAVRKYMSEYLALDRPGVAHSVYRLCYRYQLISAIAIAGCGIAGVALIGDPAYRVMSELLLLSIVPGLMSRVPAQAYNAFEDVQVNTISAFGYIVSYVLVIVLTIWLRWDLIGIAAASLVGRTVEVVMRTIPLNRTLRQFPLDKLERELVLRIRRFCLQAMGVQLLMSVVWDRSELFFLRHFSSFVQIGFYSLSYTLCNNLLTPPRILGNSIGITLMVEAGRDPRRVPSLIQNASRYLLLVVLPICLGAAAVMLPVVRLFYGDRYIGAIPVLITASILCIPRAFLWIPETLTRTADRQNRLLLWYSVTAVVNVTLDYFLIKRYDAVGAAWGNGLAQSFGVIVMWYQARHFYEFRLPKQAALRIGLASVIMAAIAYEISHKVHGAGGLVLAIVAAIVSYIVLLRLFSGLEPADRLRLAPMGDRLPASLRRAYLATIAFATPSGA